MNTKIAQEIDTINEKRSSADEMMSMLLKDKQVASILAEKIKGRGLN